jgi:6-phosphogluconolactonase
MGVWRIILTTSINWLLFPSAEDVALDAARRIQSAAASCIKEHGNFKIVLAGGTTPAASYKHLIDTDTDWSRWQIFYGDERCLPPDHPDRNSVMAARVWLNHIDIPAANIHPIPAELGAIPAASQYETVIQPMLPFDMTLLGIGEDGHTASLFPGHSHPEGKLVVPVTNAPKPPSDRVSLSFETLANSHSVLVLVTGAGKRDAVAQWRVNADIPIQQLTRHISADVLIDQDAIPG